MRSIQDVWLHSHSLIRAARQVQKKLLEPLGLSGTEGNMLLHLLVYGDGVSQEALARELDVGKAAISRAVDALADKDYLRREREAQDRRAHRLLLTDKARLVASDLINAYDRIYNLAIGDITPGEFDATIALIERITGNMERAARDMSGDT